MKKTAVHWLEDIILNMEQHGADLPPLMIHIQKAKEMEKEQIMLASGAGYKDGILYANGEQWIYETVEQYYNEPYKQD
jgi:hypothetical protein